MQEDLFLRRVRVEKYLLDYEQLPLEEKEAHQAVLLWCIARALACPVIDVPSTGPTADHRLQ